MNSQSTRLKRSKIKGDLDTKYMNINTKQRNSQYTRQKSSKIKGDLDAKYKNTNINRVTHSPKDTRDLK